MKVYLAGPMSGKPNFNFPAFTAGAKKLRSDGHEVFSPHEADLDRWGSLKRIKQFANYRECLKTDLVWICDNAEAIALLPGWENSKGVAVELALAKALDLEIIEIGN
jgi:hypothetical protein